MKFTLNGETWKIRVLSQQSFQNEFGGKDMCGIGAVTIPRIKLILVNSEENLELEVVMHELTHAYYETLCLGSADLDARQVQEVFAEVIARRSEMLRKLSKELLKALS